MFQTSQLTTEVPQLPFVFQVGRCPLLCRSCLPYPLLSTTGAQGSDSAENRRGPATAVHQVRRQFPVVVQRLIPMVLVIVEIPQLQFIDKVIDGWFVRDPANSGVAVRRQLRSHSLRLVVFFRQSQMLFPLVRLPQRFSSCSTLIRWSTSIVQVLQFSSADVEETAELPQLQLVELKSGCCMPVVWQQQSCRMVRSEGNCVFLAVAVPLTW